MLGFRIIGALAALVLAGASPSAGHGLQPNPSATGYRRATAVVRRAAMPRIVVHEPAPAPPAAHRPSAPHAPAVVRDDCPARRSSFGSQALAVATAAAGRTNVGSAFVVHPRAIASPAAVFHDANAPPVRVSSVIRPSA